MNSPTPPEDFAAILLACLQLNPPIPVSRIARELGFKIRKVNLTGFEGIVLRDPFRAGGIIAVPGGRRGFSRQKFTIAHEIGHYVLHRKTSACVSADMQVWNPSLKAEERAANRFATELLLPTQLVAPVVHQRGVSIETAKFVKDTFKVSLTTAAFRCVELSLDNCALVRTVDGVVMSYCPTGSWKYRVFTGYPLRRDTLASKLMEDESSLEQSGLVSTMAWADGSNFKDFGGKLFEDSIHLSRYKTILSFLTAVT